MALLLLYFYSDDGIFLLFITRNIAGERKRVIGQASGLERFRRWFWMPTAVFVLGVVSTVMLFWVYHITEKQMQTFEHVDAIMDVQVKTATFHLWFEEAISEGRYEDMETTFSYIDDAISLSAAIRFGGESEHGTAIAPLADPAVFRDAKRVDDLLVRLREIALKRVDHPESSGLGSAIDERFDAVFEQFQAEAQAFERSVEKDWIKDHVETRRLIFIIVLIWAVVITASMLGLYRRELGRRRAEQALETAYEEMEQRVRTAATEKIVLQVETLRAAHLASIGKLAAGVAHEINNPINGIINYARILSNKSAEGSAERDVAERISKEGRRIAGIVKGLLSFARDGGEEKKPVSLESVLREALVLTEAQMKKEGITVRLEFAPGLPDIIANGQQLQQVFMNLISNAQYALNQRYPGEHEKKVLEISGEEVAGEGGPFVRVVFHDQGTGISPEDLDKIMNPFFTRKPAGKGTGLGLSITHGIIADHGGRISVKSVKGEFTRVVIELPARIADCGVSKRSSSV
jgi:signal transduction histidine kinase